MGGGVAEVTREASSGVHVDRHHVFDRDVGLDDAPQGGRRAEPTARRGSAEAASGQRARGGSGGGLEESRGRGVEVAAVELGRCREGKKRWRRQGDAAATRGEGGGREAAGERRSLEATSTARRADPREEERRRPLEVARRPLRSEVARRLD